MTKMTKEQTAKSLAALKADIAAAVESATTMRERIQHALVGCVSHWKLTGSNAGLLDIINEFIVNLGQGVNLQAVKAWCELHLHMVEDIEGKKLVFKAIKSDKLDTHAANECKWWSLKQQQVFSFDLTQAIIALAKKAAKANDELESNPDADVKIDKNLYAAIKKLENQAVSAQA